MKKLLFLFLVGIVLSSNLNAKVWRVSSVAGVDADYSTFLSALNSSFVVNGDTIYVESGTTTTSSIDLNKQLVIIGPGYFLADNPETQADLKYATFSELDFEAGSQGSVIKGCVINSLDINTSNIIVENNYIYNISLNASSLITINGTISNVILRKNFIYYRIEQTNSGRIGVSCSSLVTGLIIDNNYIYTFNSYSYSPYAIYCLSGEFRNNVIYGSSLISNAVFNNNIVAYGTFTLTNTFMNYNICNSTQCGTENGNQAYISMSSVFTGSYSSQADKGLILKSDSPAIGAGDDGTDCGIFGGNDPYILSGLPDIPAIYYYEQIIDNLNQSLQIVIKAKSH